MIKDIPFPKINDVKIAVGKEINEKGESDWYVFVINNKPITLSNLLVVSDATEKEDGSGRKTSTLRHFIEEVEVGKFSKIERIDPAVFGFYNRFWLSFYIGRELFDKKFVLHPFNEFDLQQIPELEMEGREAF